MERAVVASYNVVDSTPFLRSSNSIADDDRSRRPSRRSSIHGVAGFLRGASSRRMMREPSMLVRETAAEQLEERQSDWAYSKPVVVLDIIWNLAFVVVAIVVLVLSREEEPGLLLRVWIVGYAEQCSLHMICVCFEYRRRQRFQGSRWGENGGNGGDLESGVEEGVEEGGGYDGDLGQAEQNGSVAKHLESANTMFSFIWWIIGFIWVSSGGQTLSQNAPQLYWLCIVFLAFDVFFVVFCVALACFIGIAVCCCLPCIIAILYAVADQEGASEEDIRLLPTYKFRRICKLEKLDGDISGSLGGIMTAFGSGGTSIEHVLSAEDAECCICLSAYEDGVELHELPCGHHFHCACVDKWLYMNATCPLCKYNIIKSSGNGRGEV